jgi:hypothetical protein
MTNEIIKNGTKVVVLVGRLIEAEATIVGYNKGWYKVTTLKAPIETLSVRANKILKVIIKKPKTGLQSQMSIYKKDYEYSTNNAGTRSLICGDPVSILLEGLALESVWEIVMKRMPEVDWDAKRVKWDKLNPGQVRMCLGNMLRAKQKREKLYGK